MYKFVKVTIIYFNYNKIQYFKDKLTIKKAQVIPGLSMIILLEHIYNKNANWHNQILLP